MYDFSQFLQSAVTDICRTDSWDNYEGTFSKYYKISQLIHTQNVAN